MTSTKINDANIFYSQLLEICENEFFSNREKLFLFFDVLKNILNAILENEKSTFTEFAKFNFVIRKYQVPVELKNKTINFRKLVNKIKKKQNYSPNKLLVSHYLQAACETIAFLTKNEIPNELEKQFNPQTSHSNENFIVNENFNAQSAKEKITNLRCTFINKTINENSIDLICASEDAEKILIATNQKTFAMFNMSWKNCLLNFTNLEVTNLEICKSKNANLQPENELHENISSYKTTNKTQVTLEPDYLLDVTEIVECFTNREVYPIIPIANKFLNRSAGIAAFKGNIINSFFDELIENIEIDFETALKNALKKKPLSMLTTMQYYKTKNAEINNFNDLLKFFRAELYDIFDNLRSIIIENYLGKTTYVEPSFISNIFGLQGRLDLMLENYNAEKNSKSIDIIELKSGKAPSQEIKISIGLNEKRLLLLPLWINHYIQIICYNMLLQSTFKENSENKNSGFSSILYSTPKEPNPIRNVVDNFFVQNEILTVRNWIVAFMRELALGNLSIIEKINHKQLNYFPSFCQEEMKKLIDNIANLTLLEKKYLKTQTAFVAKEIFANKIGFFANSQHSRNNSLGFSSLWLLATDEKKLKGTIITNLALNKNESNFATMHLKFDLIFPAAKMQKTFFTTFRKGDICILYPTFSTDFSTDFFDDSSDNISDSKGKKTIHSSDNININNSSSIDSREKTSTDSGENFENGGENNFADSNEISFSPTCNQLFRGRIMEIDDTNIVVSFRNKIPNKLLNSACFWNLEADYIEVMNSYLFASISDFLFSDFENKDCLLGLCEPIFADSKKINTAISRIKNLTSEKASIIKSALSAKNYFLIQGPPGSGKTSFILRYLVQILFQNTAENILILAYTNRAVDEICNNLNKIISENKKKNFDFIRLGSRDSTEHSEKLLSNFSLENIAENVENCRCFVSTIATANATPELFQLKKIDTVIVDEAAQILENHIIGLLSKAKRFIMIGDEKQLPAVTSLATKELIIDDELMHGIGLFNLGDSLFERLLRICKQNNWAAFAMLEEQSRMNEKIMQIANNLFYGNKLKASAFIQKDFFVENIASEHFFVRKNCIFMDTKIENNSKINFFEVAIILELIAEIKILFGDKFDSKTLGIISPWRMQCNEILNRLSDADKNLVTVDTVERFQGSEREIIIFSTATNNIYQLDLLSEDKLIDGCFVDRKLNVALTRAKQKFILLGNKILLSKKEVYKNLIAQIENN